MHKFTRITLLLSASFLSACSTVTFLYPKLDWIIPHYIDDYVSLSETQSLQFDQSLQMVLQWHCTTPVKQYSSWLRRIAVDIESDTLNKQKIADYMAQTSEFWHDLSLQVVPKIVPILNTIDDVQIKQLFTEFAEKNADNQRDYIDIPFVDLRLKTQERMQQRFEKWLGELNEKQTKAIERWSYTATKRTPGWVASRLKWQQTLREVLSSEQKKNQSTTALTQLLSQPESLWTEAYRADRMASRREISKLMFLAYQSISLEQRYYLLQQLDTWATDIGTLSCEKNS